MGADSQKPEAASERQPLVNAAFAPRPPAGADLQNPSPDLLLWAYGHGVFPMGDPESGRLEWFSPDPRGIIPLHPSDAFQIPKNLAREVRKNRFEIRTDAAFEQVMRGCATDRGGFNRSWINETIIRTYCQLHQMGHAHSVEAWVGGALVGGLYGVQIGGAFFGESNVQQVRGWREQLIQGLPGASGSTSASARLHAAGHAVLERASGPVRVH